jgi:hypothetical protein
MSSINKLNCVVKFTAKDLMVRHVLQSDWKSFLEDISEAIECTLELEEAPERTKFGFQNYWIHSTSNSLINSERALACLTDEALSKGAQVCT